MDEVGVARDTGSKKGSSASIFNETEASRKINKRAVDDWYRFFGPPPPGSPKKIRPAANQNPRS